MINPASDLADRLRAVQTEIEALPQTRWTQRATGHIELARIELMTTGEGNPSDSVAGEAEPSAAALDTEQG